jgi:hypothetical protein
MNNRVDLEYILRVNHYKHLQLFSSIKFIINQSLLLVSSAGDLHTQDALAAVDQVGIVLGSTVLEVYDGARLLVNLLGELGL